MLLIVVPSCSGASRGRTPPVFGPPLAFLIQPRVRGVSLGLRWAAAFPGDSGLHFGPGISSGCHSGRHVLCVCLVVVDLSLEPHMGLGQVAPVWRQEVVCGGILTAAAVGAWLGPTGRPYGCGHPGDVPSQVSLGRQTDKQYAVCAYDGVVFSLKKAKDSDTLQCE